MKSKRELRQQGWLGVKHSVLDDSFGMLPAYMVLSFYNSQFNFHFNSHFNSRNLSY